MIQSVLAISSVALVRLFVNSLVNAKRCSLQREREHSVILLAIVKNRIIMRLSNRAIPKSCHQGLKGSLY